MNARIANAPATLNISNRDYVNSLARGLEVIRAFTRSTPRMTLSDIARATGMTRATVRRFLLTLVREGYADTDGKYFAPAARRCWSSDTRPCRA